MMARTRVSRLLGAYRDRPAADADAVADVLERLAMLAIDLPEIAELDINPLLADEDGVIALDARISLTQDRRRLAIRPYPEDLAGELVLPDGGRLHVRPIRPQDEPALVDLVARTSREDMRLRVHGPVRQLPHVWAARLTQIDYDREMAFVALGGPDEILGVARLFADPEGASAEFAILVRSDQQQKGIGGALLRRLLEHGAARGLHEIWGSVLAENHRMLAMTKDLGFGRRPSGDLSVIEVVKVLDTPSGSIRKEISELSGQTPSS
ncbi:MAG TPA: GNAT family N-acetyltransferase, partial [Phenylobacterium sp.]